MVFLTGAPASGKTTLGRLASERLGVPFFDLDEVIVEATCKTIPEIFAEVGEPAFRDIEADALARTVRTAPSSSIVSLGGGISM